MQMFIDNLLCIFYEIFNMAHSFLKTLITLLALLPFLYAVKKHWQAHHMMGHLKEKGWVK